MLTGDRVVLRAIREDDLPALYAWKLDIASWLALEVRAPWPVPMAAFREHWETWRADPDNVDFAIEADGALVGRCGFFKFDGFARNAEIGISVGREYHGLGYASDAMRVLARYGFAIRGLHRLQLETLLSNTPARRAFAAAGFQEEVRLRQNAWVDGEYLDSVVMSLLRPEWAAASG